MWDTSEDESFSMPDNYLGPVHVDDKMKELAAKDAAFRRAISWNPKDAGLLVKYAAFVWSSYGAKVLAENLYNLALKIDPANPNVLASYANFLFKTETPQM